LSHGKSLLLLGMVAGLLAAGSLGGDDGPTARAPQRGVFFDDLNYADAAAMVKGGWTIRTQKGLPGLEGAVWGTDSVAILDDPGHPDNRIVRLMAETGGAGTATRQAQICQARKYLEGTYAVRVRFAEKPASGPKCDQVVQSFYTACPLARDLDPDYSELDFEYLANGGWGERGQALVNTSWETVQIEPWIARNQQDRRRGGLSGWHVLIIQVAGGTVRYLLDGKQVAEHGGKNYPRVPMAINFNLWFIREGVGSDRARRVWYEDIDWVLHVKDQVLPPKAVETLVAGYRQDGTRFLDNVPAADPPLPCPCDL
jgi:hypothetical protein